MPMYQNPHSYTVHLAGPDGVVVQVSSRQIVNLSEHFDRYRERGFIRLLPNQNPAPNQSLPKTDINLRDAKPILNGQKRAVVAEARQHKQNDANRQSNRIHYKSARPSPPRSQTVKVVGKEVTVNPETFSNASDSYPISNNIGIGILSYNRKSILERLVNSIFKNTDLLKSTLFISDDASDDAEMIEYLDRLSENPNVIIIKNNKRLGVAGNSNRLLRALSRFQYGILLNDDIEIIKPGWEIFYSEFLKDSKLEHAVFRKEGIYYAKLGDIMSMNGTPTRFTKDKPHGALLAFTNRYVNTVGAFDTRFGLYGLEHVDWSMRGFEFGIQPEGFFDAVGSEQYVTLHHEESCIGNKAELMRNAKEVFSKRLRGKIEFDEDSVIPSISYIIPFRELGRSKSLETVVANIRAQRFPEIEIILSEQDSQQRVDTDNVAPIKHLVIGSKEEHLFNKSLAFNAGVMASTKDKIILHDADMLAIGYYTSSVSKVLDQHSACHLGATVLYANQETTDIINVNHDLKNVKYERVVGYYEGGSLACTKDAYWKSGGFNEDFWGYGNEDTEFYSRLASLEDWLEQRTFDLVHLWHPRTTGWTSHHEKNKKLEKILKALDIKVRIAKTREAQKKKGYIQ